MAKWAFDPAHASAGFSAKHMMVMTVRGNFEQVSGTLEYDPENPAASSVEATIQAASIATGVADRDGHLKSPDFLDVENYPVITFKSTNVEMISDTQAKVTGDLTIRETTKPATLDVQLIGEQKNPFTGTRTLGFSAETQINREDFGLTWNQTLETGGVLVGKEINIHLDVEAIPVEAAQPT